MAIILLEEGDVSYGRFNNIDCNGRLRFVVCSNHDMADVLSLVQVRGGR